MNENLIQDMIDALDEASFRIFNAYKALEEAKDTGVHVSLEAQKKELYGLCDELEDLCGYYERELRNRQNGGEEE